MVQVVTIRGTELAEKIRKGQFKTGRLGGRTARAPDNLASCTCRVARIHRETKQTICALFPLVQKLPEQSQLAASEVRAAR